MKMPNYYFDTSDGKLSIEDSHGVELSDDAAAEREAIAAAVSMAKDLFPRRDCTKVLVTVRTSAELIFEAAVALELRPARQNASD
jgi:hypothetical protein